MVASALLSLLWVAAPYLKALLPTSQPPIVINGPRIAWVDYDVFETRSAGADINRECDVVKASRLLLLKDGNQVGLVAKFISGPLSGTMRPPRYDLNPIKPGHRDGSVIQYTVPSYVDPAEIDQFIITFRVPANAPCKDGFTGAFGYSLDVPPNPWPASRGDPLSR